MNTNTFLTFIGIWILGSILVLGLFYKFSLSNRDVLSAKSQDNAHWLMLNRKSNMEELYRGVPGDTSKSTHIKTFIVKSGIPGERPTPLPQLLDREYWIIVEKHEELDNPETAPYFLSLNIPAPTEEPFGPTPYEECNGQCSWVIPGAFGLHGSGGDPSKLSPEDPGSSGCIRHSDEDIMYLYNLLNPQTEEIRYYIQDT